MSDVLTIDIVEWCLSHLGSARSSAKEVSAICPWCGRGGGSFRINATTGLFRCYKCHDKFSPEDDSRSWGFFPRLVAHVEGISVGEAARKCFGRDSLWSPAPNPERLLTRAPNKQTARVWNPLPPGCVRCFDQERKEQPWKVPSYLTKRRGCTRDAVKAFDMRYATEGPLEGRVVLPIKGPHGISYTARSMFADLEPRYMNPSEAGFEHLLFAWTLLPKQLAYIVIVEGPFDAIRLWQHGIPAISLLGKNCSETQADLICTLVHGSCASVFVMLDPEERVQQYAVARSLVPATSDIRIAKLPLDVDPGDSSAEQAWTALDSARPFLGLTSEISERSLQVQERLKPPW